METAILTLRLDERSHAELTELRTRHFPPERNYLSAHVTLFHALPLGPAVETAVGELAGETEPFSLSFPRALFLGAGTAIAIEGAPLLALRARLAKRFDGLLTRQDQSGFRPHVTIQNKVPAREAKAFFADFSGRWRPRTGCAEGLDLWIYEGGPWRFHRTYGFTSSSGHSTTSPS